MCKTAFCRTQHADIQFFNKNVRFFVFVLGNALFCATFAAKKAMNTYYNLSAEQMDKIKERACRFNEPWSQEERDAVVSQFQHGRSVEEIARLQGRTANAIRIKLVQAGEIAPHLSRRGKEWTDAETERLGRFYSQGYPVEACAKMLGRLLHDTEGKLIEIGLLDLSEAETMRGVDVPKAYEPWTEEETELLKEELARFQAAFADLAEVAAEHGRSVTAIISHAERIGLFRDATGNALQECF